MPKSSSKEIVEDSEEEQVRVNRKSKNKTHVIRVDVDEEEKEENDNDNGNDNDNEKEEQEGDEEEEYEIESIINAQVGVFDGGKVGYLVKWKGYGPEHDSWVTESDAENAKELIDQYWRKKKKTPRDLIQHSSKSSRGRPRKSDERATSGQKRKKSSGTSTPTRKRGTTRETDDEEEEAERVGEYEIEEVEKPPKPAKRAKTSYAEKTNSENGVSRVAKQDSPEADDDRPAADYRPADEELTTKKSWEKIVKTIDTIEHLDGELKIFFTLNNGDKIFANSSDCRVRFPQKLIQFYEANLRWRETD